MCNIDETIAKAAENAEMKDIIGQCAEQNKCASNDNCMTPWQIMCAFFDSLDPVLEKRLITNPATHEAKGTPL